MIPNQGGTKFFAEQGGAPCINPADRVTQVASGRFIFVGASGVASPWWLCVDGTVVNVYNPPVDNGG